KIEIFSGPDEEGKTFEDSVFADASGNFTSSVMPIGPYVTATATDASGNTSEFSDSVLVTRVDIVDSDVPGRYSLSQNYPNPFNPETTIRFDVKAPCRVVLKVYNLLGREMAKLVDEPYQPGRYQIQFDATGCASGIHFYRIEMGDFQSIKKMIILD
ncbi:T9SS type A sorting domain-containing protein, partial [bacterium]